MQRMIPMSGVDVLWAERLSGCSAKDSPHPLAVPLNSRYTFSEN